MPGGDLLRGQDKDAFVAAVAAAPRLTLGFAAAYWAIKYLIQPNGPKAGQRYMPTMRQMLFWLHWYGVNEDGTWIYHHGVRRLAKGPIAHTVPVMTPTGWRKHGELSVGDYVFAVDGSATQVIELGDEVYEDCYRVTFRDGSSVVCTGSHRWPVAEFTGGSKRVDRIATVREMFDAGVSCERRLTTGRTKATRGDVARWRTLPSPPVEGSETDLPIDPYIFGYWLGDGDSDANRITVDAVDKAHLVEQLQAAGYTYGESFTGRQGNAYRVRFSPARGALVGLGVLRNKHIPATYLRASVAQRWNLLQGLVDSDGHVGKTGQVEVSVMVGKLADDIEELVIGLGLMPTRTDANATLDGRVVGTRARIRFSPQPGEVAARLPRKAERLRTETTHAMPFSRSRTIISIEPVETEPARCITVDHPSHQYLVGERNVPTCNSGKSPNAAVQSLIELCAPVRLKDFDPRLPGGCVGMPVSMPLVQIAAVSEDQTENTMRMVRAFARKGSRVVVEHGLDPGKTIYHKDDGGKLHVVTNSAHSAEGAEATHITADETEHWLGKAGKDFHGTLADNAAKSGSRMVETCNAWNPSLDSVAKGTFDTWVEQEELLLQGRPTKSGSLILCDARIAPVETDLADYDSLIRALEWVYDDCWWVKPSNYIPRIWHKGAREDDSKRKYLNWPSVADGTWVEPQDWAAMAADGIDGRPKRELVDGERIVLFVDGSKSRDATAVVGCALDDGHVFTLGVWEPKICTAKVVDEDGDTLQVDSAQIDLRVLDASVSAAHERFDVVAFWSDVREIEGLAKVTWPERWADQYDQKLWAVRSGQQPEPIAWDMRSHSREFAFAAELVQAEIEDGAFTHDGNAVTTRHVLNCREAETRWGAVTVSKETPSSPDKIDAAVCVIGARLLYKVAMANAPEPDMPATAFFINRHGGG